MRAIGLARYTATTLQIIPYITQYGPLVFSWIENAQSTWAGFKKAHPTFAGIIQNIASKLLPNIEPDKAAEITLIGMFWPGKMKPEYEAIWFGNKSDIGTGG